MFSARSRSGVSRRVVSLVLAGLFMSGGAVAAASAASAAPAGCPSGYSCGWKDRDYLTAGTSTALTFSCSIRNITTVATWDNNITSVYNNSSGGNTAVWFTDINYHGTPFYVAANAGFTRLNESYPNINDHISSGYYDTPACRNK